MIVVSYAPFAAVGQYGLALAAIQPPKPVVSFNVQAAGETVCLTSDGFKVTLRIRVKGLRRAGTDKGVAFYDLDFEVMPTVAPLLSIHQHEGERAN